MQFNSLSRYVRPEPYILKNLNFQDRHKSPKEEKNDTSQSDLAVAPEIYDSGPRVLEVTKNLLTSMPSIS